MIIFIFLIVALISEYYAIIALPIFLLVLKLLKQPTQLSLLMEDRLTNLTFSYRVGILAKVLKDSCVITGTTLHTYVLAILYGELINFKELFFETINELQLGFFLKDAVDKISPREFDQYLLKLKYFKYKKITHRKLNNEYTEDELTELKNFWDKARNPKLNFVVVSHMPIKLKNTVESNVFFKIIISNTLVIYNFIKTTLVSLILMSLYFLYTIFFFKIQFLKQLSV